MRTRRLALLLLLLAAARVGAPLRAQSSAQSSAQDSATIKAADKGRVAGNAAATVWLVEVSDFQCPWCKKFHDETFGALKKEYVDSGKIRLAYLNFPLGMHPNAMPAALSAMCASAQGKFWEMHDKLFDTQGNWEKLANPRAFFDSLALALGLKAASYKSCFDSPSSKLLVETDRDNARTAGVQSTPTFFVQIQAPGKPVTTFKKLEGAYPVADFRKVLDAALAAAKK